MAAAESAVKEAEGQAEATRRLADAQLYAARAAADGALAAFEAQADGLSRLLAASEQRPDLAKFQLALQSGLFEKMATTTADAVRGMSPKIHIWNTGPGGGDASAGLNPLRNILSSLPPMLDAVEGQTDFRAPERLAGVRPGSPKTVTKTDGSGGLTPKAPSTEGFSLDQAVRLCGVESSQNE